MSNDKDNFNMSDLNAGTFEFSKTLISLSLSLSHCFSNHLW